MSIRIAPSILSADLAKLADEIALVEAGGADWIHIDVMDGRFVPNLTFGAKVIESVRKLTKLPLDVHLMVVQPENYFESFAAAGANGMSIHTEVSPHLQRQLNRIRELGCRAGAVVNPATPLTAVSEVITDIDLLLVMTVNPGFGGQKFIKGSIDKVRRAREMLAENGSKAFLEVDGGIDRKTIKSVWEAGADTFVAGNAIFGAKNPKAEIGELRALHGTGMTGRQQLAIGLFVVGITGIIAYGATRYLRKELFPVAIGSKAPDFKAFTLDSIPREKRLADYRGQVVMINVWATWCLPCRVEMPSIEALHKTYGPKGLKILAVSIDDPGTDSTIRAFVKQYGLTFEVLHDPKGTISDTYDIAGYPETFILGKDGVIRKKLMSATDWNSPAARALVDRLLTERTE